MKTLQEAIRDHAGKQAQALEKHLTASGIETWGDLTKANLADFRDALRESVAPSSVKTYTAVLRAILARYEEEGIIPCKNFAEILRAKGEKPVKTYLTSEDIERLERVMCATDAERFVLNEFLVGTRTGARISDLRTLTPENISGGVLTYTSQKTGVTASVPCSPKTAERIAWIQANDMAVTLKGYNEIIRRLCRRAGITERVKIHKAGKDKTAPKCDCVSSHTARISFCTNLAKVGVPIIDISKLCGHTNTGMTSRYICNYEIKLNDLAMAYFE